MTLDEALEAAVDRGDYDEAARIDVATWVVGVGRAEADVEPAIRERAFGLARAVYPLMEHEDEFEYETNAQARLTELQVPTLAVGEHDRPVARAIAEAVRDRVAGAQLVLMPGVAHLPPVEDPDAFADVVLEFLQEVKPT